MEILGVLALLACPVGMGAMMWFMSRGKSSRHDDTSSASQLRAQRSALDAQIASLERTEQRGIANTRP